QSFSFFGRFKVTLQRGLHNLRPHPQSIMHAVPRMHFRTRLTIQAVKCQTSLLRWIAASTLHLGDVLGEYDPPFQLCRPWISTSGKVYCRSAQPKRFPRSSALLLNSLITVQTV